MLRDRGPGLVFRLRERLTVLLAMGDSLVAIVTSAPSATRVKPLVSKCFVTYARPP
ncbi:Uncharacterised protein [Mycobacteroides abscessus subsp. abscessus]|nr:Uncharacterised protein [Mycobacteroides abscessus subsp. abscessus]SKU10053.1 Uncharacterised protein [Mycobacteroides abscessus subsp. abscessus]SKV02492.1 Uncharacterised protein [Mycobacteroides abscessus subsp. abscessus]